VPLQLSPNYASGTFTAANRSAVVEAIRTVLLAATWTDVSGGVGDRKMDSVATADSLQTRVRLYDPGSGNCARIQFMSVDELQQGIDLFLLPTSGTDYTYFAGDYQFMILLGGSLSPGRFVAGGVPYLESFLSGADAPITQAIWCHGNTSSDAATIVKDSFRNRSTLQDSQWAWQSLNGNAWGGSTSGTGSQRLAALLRSHDGNLSIPAGSVQYKNRAAVRVPPRLMWGLNAADVESKVQGQLWDMALIHEAVAMDSTKTFEGNTWQAVTDSNTVDFGQASVWARQ